MSMKIRVRDVISHMGRDYVVEGVLSYNIAGKVLHLARAVDGDKVVWVEPLTDDLDDRLLLFEEVKDLNMATPPPRSISYRGQAYVPRFDGTADVEVAGKVKGRSAGACRVWRYRAPGDLFLQVEDWSGTTVVLAGESVHKGMIEVLPAR